MALSEIRWWWVRHAPSLVASGEIAGSRDVACELPPPGNVAGLAAGLAARLPGTARRLVSPLARTMATARFLCPGAAFAVEPAFVEQDFGAWEGKSWSDASIPPEFWRDMAGFRPPGGESFTELTIRVGAAIERINRESDSADILAVAHAGTIRAALALALGLEPARALSFAIEPLSLTRIDAFPAGGGWRVAGVNWLETFPRPY